MSAPEAGDVTRLREALLSLRGTGGEAVDAERIFEAVHGSTMSAEERRALVDALVANPAAAEAWQLARELAPEVAASTTLARSEAWRWMAIAATLVLAVGVGWRFGPWGTTSEPVYRSVEEQAITSGLADGAVLTRTAPVLRWTPIEGARYRVRVLTPDLDVLVEADELTEAEYTLGPEVLGRLAPGSQVLWQVEARAAGRGALESPTFTVRVE